MLTDPALLGATATSVRVVWFTEWPGRRHEVELAGRRRLAARTTLLSRTAEDQHSRVAGRTWPRPTRRPVWRHEAVVDGLRAGERVGYRVASTGEDGRDVTSEWFRLAAPGTGDLLLLTSDHQLRPLTAANLQAAHEVAGDRLGGVLCAGDLVNMPDRASEWFDDAGAPDGAGGCAFFPAMQGRASVTVAGRRWRGAPILQRAPLYPALGNHEVTGGTGESLHERSERVQPGMADTTTYQEIFGRPRWYATTIGPVRLIVLFAARVWRPASWDGSVRGTFAEATADLADPTRWGHGQHPFASLARGSEQYEWLARELADPASRAARYRVVMMHHPVHSIGWTGAPPFTDPVAEVERDLAGAVTAVRYEYPLATDQLLRDVEPLLAAHRVPLVLTGHTHLWNRFRNHAGTHFLETSNVGNTFGAFLPGVASRPVPGPEDGFKQPYAATGDAGGLEPVVPSAAPWHGPDGAPLPYHASDTVTAFSLLDTTAGVVRSYRFDPAGPTAGAELFDELVLM